MCDCACLSALPDKNEDRKRKRERQRHDSKQTHEEQRNLHDPRPQDLSYPSKFGLGPLGPPWPLHPSFVFPDSAPRFVFLTLRLGCGSIFQNW
jgi:hypothetical protein